VFGAASRVPANRESCYPAVPVLRNAPCVPVAYGLLSLALLTPQPLGHHPATGLVVNPDPVFLGHVLRGQGGALPLPAENEYLCLIKRSTRRRNLAGLDSRLARIRFARRNYQ
jgi:hypothetical protein